MASGTCWHESWDSTLPKCSGSLPHCLEPRKGHRDDSLPGDPKTCALLQHLPQGPLRASHINPTCVAVVVLSHCISVSLHILTALPALVKLRGNPGSNKVRLLIMLTGLSQKMLKLKGGALLRPYEEW